MSSEPAPAVKSGMTDIYPRQTTPIMRMSAHIVDIGERRFFEYIPGCSSMLKELLYASENSPEINDSIVKDIGHGEVLRESVGAPRKEKPRNITVRNGYVLVTHITTRVFVEKNGIYRAEGDEKLKLLPPSDKWMGRRDEDGWPEAVFDNRDDAIRDLTDAGYSETRARELASKFYRAERYDKKDGDAAVYRFSSAGCGPWSLYAVWHPGVRSGIVGGRPVEILPMPSREAGKIQIEPGFVIDAKSHAELMRYLNDAPNISPRATELREMLGRAKRI